MKRSSPHLQASGRTPPPPLLELEGVELRHGARAVLRDVSWTLRPGEVWAIAGASEKTRSALAAALAGDAPIAAGRLRAWLRGRRGAQARASSAPWKAIAHVTPRAQRDLLRRASGYHQSRWHAGEDDKVPTVREVLADGAGSRRAASRLGLSGLGRRKVSELSSGERRKLLIARALAQRPALLILEDPFTGLDARSRRGLLGWIRRLLGAESCLVLLLPPRERIPPAVSHVLLLGQGRVLAAGPRAIIERHPSLRAAASAMARPTRHRSRPPRAPRAEPAVIDLREVTVRYAEAPILRRVSWTVCRGERWALLGANGAGKSTLLSLILADNPQAYANEVQLFGRRRGSGETIWELKRRIGWVAPELHLHHPPRGSAIEVVASGFHDSVGLYRPCTQAQLAQARRWLRRLALARVADRPFAALSEGEQRTALLARALVKEPELLVLDEPCQGLDAAARDRFLRWLDRIARRGPLTLIYVTHLEDELPESLTHRLILARGRVVAQGPWSRLRRDRRRNEKRAR